jgi:type IV pilus assembly protein PilW
MNSMQGRVHARGLTLVELMVAMAIGVFLMAGAVTVFGKTRDLYRTNDSAARLQETARFAMSTLEADLRMANYWGLNNRPDLILNSAGAGEAVPGPLATAAAQIDACGDNWAIDLTNYVDGENNGYTLACAAFGTAAAATDVLTVRRASVSAIPDALLTNGPLKVQSSRVQGSLVSNDIPPGPLAESRRLVVHGYYVSQDSNDRPGTPSLRRKSVDLSVAAGVVDEEIIPGIEDIQFQVGVDCGTGRLVPCPAGVIVDDRSADYFVDPDALPIDDADTPVAVRVWILARAEQPEVGFTDDRIYQYADRPAFQPNDNFRRILVSKTVALRNTR